MTRTLPPPDPARLAINTASVREKWNLREAVAGCDRHRIAGIAAWRDQLAQLGVKQAAKIIRDHGLSVASLCGGGMFPAADRKGRRAAIDDTLRAVDESAILEAACLVIVSGGLATGSKDLAGAREMVRDGMGEALEHARSAGVALAIEPQHPMLCADRGCVDTLAQALDLCDELGTGIGVAVDVYQVWWDPQLERQIERAGDKRLLAYQISDWLVPTLDPVNNRGMMGDGVIDLPLVRSWMEQAGYRGFHEAEIPSARHWWKRDPNEVLGMCRERHQSAS